MSVSLVDQVKGAVSITKEILDAIKELKTILGIDAVKNALLGDKNAAKKELREAFDKIEKAHQQIVDSFKDIFKIKLDHAEDKDAGLALLRDTASFGITNTVGKVGGFCTRVWKIYDEHLKSWFARALNPQQASELKDVFIKLGHNDKAQNLNQPTPDELLMLCMENLDNVVRPAAESLVKEIENHPDDASKSLNAFKDALFGPIREMEEAIKSLQEIKGKFI